jgi:hypothetical protein
MKAAEWNHQTLFAHGGRRERGMGLHWRGRTCSKHTVHMDGIITMKPLILLMYASSKM